MTRDRNPYRHPSGEPPIEAEGHAAVLRAMFRADIPDGQVQLIEAICAAIQALNPDPPAADEELIGRLRQIVDALRGLAADRATPPAAAHVAYQRAEAIRAALTALGHPYNPHQEGPQA